MDSNALFKVSYGLFVLTAQEGEKDNGCIINTVLQVGSTEPYTSLISVNKQIFTHDMIVKSKKCNISVLTTEASFDIFKRFGYQSGRDVNKFEGFDNVSRSDNGLIYLPQQTNAYISMKILDTFDFGTHSVFKTEVTDAKVLSDKYSLTYTYYQQHIKPKPQSTEKSGFRCKICNYVYEGDTLPADYICPICKHGAADFVKI